MLTDITYPFFRLKLDIGKEKMVGWTVIGAAMVGKTPDMSSCLGACVLVISLML
jgi:hypothetical protein